MNKKTKNTHRYEQECQSHSCSGRIDMYDSDLKSQEQKCQSHTCSARTDMYDSDLKSQESVKLTIDNPQPRSH
jgi:hypothetical protein